ncbi:Uncharacterised protein [Candidatus Ornithobacterium hominis]|uniref:CopG family transcriptional regulator n=1 Tax=Candidatus Ornithobacterium hominis TaxID=2497989 RepID=UPI000E5C063F|nr:CopG family transcriptional regulator [Candidatus Ornithobacterium hominis]SZD72032.1 Uncharacterised protein [Candidatus Ornithobacterium hominis]
MDTILVKKSILQSFYEIVNDLSLEEVEDLKDTLTAREFQLEDDGERISLEELKKELEDE